MAWVGVGGAYVDIVTNLIADTTRILSSQDIHIHVDDNPILSIMMEESRAQPMGHKLPKLFWAQRITVTQAVNVALFLTQQTKCQAISVMFI